MKLVKGIADARKIALVENDDTLSVLVTDAGGYVRLSISGAAYPAGLTPGQARQIAKDLVASANRVEAVGEEA